VVEDVVVKKVHNRYLISWRVSSQSTHQQWRVVSNVNRWPALILHSPQWTAVCACGGLALVSSIRPTACHTHFHLHLLEIPLPKMGACVPINFSAANGDMPLILYPIGWWESSKSWKKVYTGRVISDKTFWLDDNLPESLKNLCYQYQRHIQMASRHIVCTKPVFSGTPPCVQPKVSQPSNKLRDNGPLYHSPSRFGFSFSMPVYSLCISHNYGRPM